MAVLSTFLKRHLQGLEVTLLFLFVYESILLPTPHYFSTTDRTELQ